MCVSVVLVFVMWVCECECVSVVFGRCVVLIETVVFVLCVGCDRVVVEFGLWVELCELVVEVLCALLVGAGAFDSGPSPILRASVGHQKWSESKGPYAQRGTEVLTLMGTRDGIKKSIKKEERTNVPG